MTEQRPSKQPSISYDACYERLKAQRDRLAVENERLREYIARTAVSGGRQSEPPSGWRPIETAPMDGSKILLAANVHAPSGKPRISIGRYTCDPYINQQGEIIGAEEGFQGDGDQCIPSNQECFTHWAPIPPFGSPAVTKSEIPAAAQSAANSGQCESRKAAQSGTAAGASGETPAVDVAPIAKLTVRDGLVRRACLYAPGLPDGDHDVFPVPLSPKGELRPHVLAEPPPAWQPIETAPQGDAIVWLPDKGAVMARLCGDLWYDLTTGWLCEPTLWAPMPAGPSETKDAGECGACDKPGEHR